jgi:hypothetical protein
MTKNVTITIDIKIARKMLGVAGFYKQAEKMSDDEVFEKVLTLIECYGATSSILEANNIKNATFTSVWDGGYQITTNCKVNMETREVFDIEIFEGAADLVNELDEEFVTIDGIEYSVSDDEDETDYWYQ